MAEQRCLVDGADLAVDVEGDGSPLVLIHGLGLSGELWNRFGATLGSHYRVLRVHLRGAPRSRELERTELSLERWADDLGAALDALDVQRPVIVGHSLGATIALKFALERPDRARALVLIGTEANLSNLAPRMLSSAEQIESGGLRAWIDEVWAKNPPFSEASLRRDPTILDEYRRLLLENDSVDYVRQCRAIASAEDLSGRLGELVPPALIVVGVRDDRTLPEHGRELASGIRSARLVEFADVGHTVPLEAPEQTAAAVDAFVDEIDTAAAASGNGAAAVLRADTTPRNPREGPFGHLDVRWVVGEHNGASLIAFGQSTYPYRATHENHYHPNAEEVVMVLSGRGTQIVGDRSLDLGPGDICFIPRNTPHRIIGTSEDQELVILWAFGGAASIETAGYVPLPDQEE
jgi:pimeloyl-ACP methyl ester carboxylesterase/quercetin dioxygenase-like cupin family protein